MSSVYRRPIVVDAIPSRRESAWGLWSFLGILILLGVATFLVKPDLSVFANLWDFLTGHVGSVTNGRTEPVSQVVRVTLPLLIADLLVSIVIGGTFLALKMYPRIERRESLQIGGSVLLLTILGEELFARLLFLGGLTKIFQGPVAFYILLLLGNGIWAGLHLIQYKGRTKNPLLVLPQFVGGIMLGYLFVRYGFWVTFWVHVVFDALLFSLNKKYRVSLVDVLSFVYAVIGLGITTLLLHLNHLGLSTLGPWVSSSARDFPALPGVSFWGYLLLLLAVDFGAEVIANLLLLDNTEVDARYSLLARLLTAPISVLLIFGEFWLLGFVVQDLITRVVIISVLSAVATNASSGSAFARVVLVEFPVVFLVVGALYTLGFWPSVGLMLIFVVVGFIPNVLRIVQQNLYNRGVL